MQNLKISTPKLIEGMILFHDVFTDDGHLVLNQGTSLTSSQIEKLKHYKVSSVFVNSNASNTHISEAPHKTDYTKLNKVYFEHMQNFEINLNKLMDSDSPEVDEEALLETPLAILKQFDSDLDIFNLLSSMKAFDASTYAHLVNVAILANVVGRWLKLPEEDLKILTLGGLLHDIGKLQIPSEILQKPSKLTSDEFEEIKEHSSYGYSILASKNLDSRIKSCALFHHEKTDGSGYPFQKKYNSTPYFAQIITIVDTYEAMTSNRVYRKGLCPFEVIGILEKEGFAKYNAQILIPFLERLVETYIGYKAILSDGRKGEIILVNKFNLSHPIIKTNNTFVDLSKEKGIDIIDLEA